MRRTIAVVWTVITGIWCLIGFLGNLETVKSYYAKRSLLTSIVKALNETQLLAAILFVVGTIALIVLVALHRRVSAVPQARETQIVEHRWRRTPAEIVRDMVITLPARRNEDVSPLAAAFDNLKRVGDKGERLLGRYYNNDAEKPTIDEVNQLSNEMCSAVRRNALQGFVRIDDFTTIEETSDDDRTLEIKAKFHDAGYLDNLNESEFLVFSLLVVRVERFKKVVERIRERDRTNA